jgi:hypothetical protein
VTETFLAGEVCLSRDGRPVRIDRFSLEDGVMFAWVRYLDGHLPGPVGGRVSGTEEDPLWEHRVHDGKVIRPGGSYWVDGDWILEEGLRGIPRSGLADPAV